MGRTMWKISQEGMATLIMGRSVSCNISFGPRPSADMVEYLPTLYSLYDLNVYQLLKLSQSLRMNFEIRFAILKITIINILMHFVSIDRDLTVLAVWSEDKF